MPDQDTAASSSSSSSSNSSSSANSNPSSIPDEASHAMLVTVSASTMLTSLPTSATRILAAYAEPLINNVSGPGAGATAGAGAGRTVGAAGQAGPAKITIKLRAIGSTPALKQTIYKISGSQEFQVLVRFIRKQLKLKTSSSQQQQQAPPGAGAGGGPQEQSLFCYVNSSFAPALDTPLINLYQNFGVDGCLQVSYCYTVAFG